MVKTVVMESLETPVMEMKDPWGSQIVKSSSSNEEENTAFSIWEENYQDLSDFCMGAFQGQCAFLIGESETTGYIGGKMDDKSVSTTSGTAEVGQGVTYGCKTLGENKDIIDAARNIFNTQMTHKYVPKEEKIDESVDMPDVWLDSPKSSIALRTDEWIKLEDNEKVDEPHQRENWDGGINTFDNTGLNSFDLLSYLCDDEIQSPDGSVSTDSASVPTQNLFQHSTLNRVEPIKVDCKPETITSINILGSSTQLDTEPSSSRVTRTRCIPKRFKPELTIEPSYARTTNRGKKRSLESDSDDRMSDCSYRENREKNNEASRKSRMNKKAKESEMIARAGQLEKDNTLLKMKVEELEKMVTSLRAAILRSAMKK
ncbi:transcription factor VBP-like [Diachasmimorpha longicaudata]|uniref:transcription factor VBP-like n=1 Tax=Diachasmimorpha longicaudata TaxID=58733 RepID=UPI0030B86DC9